ncbi:MAG: PLP-dependent aminotransferase family protein [Longimicrobiaceae bacterium]
MSDVTAMIQGGTLRPGDRMPSVRRLSAQRGVSAPTVLHAYRLLEARRVIAARARSGFYVLPPQRAPVAEADRRGLHLRPGEIATSDLIMRVLDMAADRTLVPLGTALPDPDLLPGAELARALRRTLRRGESRSGLHPTPAGTEELRREIARRALEAGGAVAADDVVVTCGCAEALTLSLRALTRPGDTVAVESPTYFGTLQALDVLGLRAVEIPVDPLTGIRLDALRATLERGGVAALVVTPNVHNPLGCVMPDEHKQELVDLLARTGVPAIEDDTYGELFFGPSRPRSLQAFDRAGMVLTCGSFSKTLAPGYRLGWAIPGRHRDAVIHLKLGTTATSPVPLQLGVAEYLASGGYEQHLRRLRRTFQGAVERLAFEIADRFPAETRISSPAGGFLLWVQLPEGNDTVELQRRALARGLSVAPGPAFSASGGYRSYLRINAGYPWSERTRRALDTLAGMIERS